MRPTHAVQINSLFFDRCARFNLVYKILTSRHRILFGPFNYDLFQRLNVSGIYRRG